MDNSSGLVDGYVTQIQQLAAKHQMGEEIASVKVKVDAVIAKAKEHIAIWVEGTPEDNWATFGGKLRFLGHIASDRRWGDILAYAGEVVKSQEPPQRKKLN